tara:strand:+ start:646 stop:828 length:183 start_codon:yes stop_codon:yes gene_type:complete
MATISDFRNFWWLVKEFHANPITKYSAEDIVSVIDDFAKDPHKTLREMKEQHKKFLEETE